MKYGIIVCLVVAGATATAGLVRAATTQPNTFVEVDKSPTGGRIAPMFFYDGADKCFVLAGGVPGANQRHFEVEHFDLASGKWTNAYPKTATFKAESGVTDAPAFGDDRHLLGDVGGITRLGMWPSAYGIDSRAHNQWAVAADSRKLYAQLLGRTLVYNLAERVWADTQAKPFSVGPFPMVWGCMCYDPVNKEIVSIGGSSDQPGGTPGTWVYGIQDNQWRHVDAGNTALAKLHDQAVAVHRRAWALLSLARNRFFVAETEAEAKADLAQRASEVIKEVEGLSVETQKFDVDDLRTAAQQASASLLKAIGLLKETGPKLLQTITPEALADLAAADEAIDASVLALAPEPPGRAHSQMAYDAGQHKILLFGGNGLDRCYCDTWVYDCQSRTWRQRFPKLVPSPRAGHVLVYLPRSGKFALAGGYTLNNGFAALPLELWTYDLAGDEWKLLMSGSARTPVGAGPDPWAGAADDNDRLVMVDTGSAGRSTWVCQVDAGQPASANAQQLSVAPGTMNFSVPLAQWEKGVKPDTAKVQQFFKDLPINQWTLITPSRGLGVREWSSTAYDSDRQQWLYWAGGHVTYKGTDVAHYSFRSNLWSQSYAPDLPLEPNGGFYVKASRSFQDRPQIPVHTYRAYAYDSTSGLMLYLDRAYNVAERQWELPLVPGLLHKGVMGTLLKPTPHGVVAFSSRGLFRFDAAKRSWEQLPGGPKLEKVWCDGDGMVYDSKRDCLWIAPGSSIFRYDFKTDHSDKVDAQVPALVGAFAFWEEQTYDPGADLVLLMPRFKQPDGKEVNLAFDPQAKNYVALDLPFSDGKAHNFSWNSAMAYDAKLGVVLLHNPVTTWALRLDRKSAATAVVPAAPARESK